MASGTSVLWAATGVACTAWCMWHGWEAWRKWSRSYEQNALFACGMHLACAAILMDAARAFLNG